jgi:asparagine synthetase B (glutamine-hydrolysing)
VTPAAAARRLGRPSLEPLELASGMVFGRRRAVDQSSASTGEPRRSPRETLEEILLEALREPPCIVAFSGGRDSSALLAETTRVARAHGLADPVPHTSRFGAAPRTDEAEWQELVISHLGLDEWSRDEVGDELDVLGPLALDVLRRHGVHWPGNIHAFRLILKPAAGRSLVTGNGGDELFNPWNGRRLALLCRARAAPRRHDLRELALALLPNSLLARRPRFRVPWLTAAAAREVGRSYAAAETELHRSWAAAVEEYLRSRYLEVISGITAAMAADEDVHLVEPFYDPRYIRACCAEAPLEGYATRSEAMRRHFGDLLPPRVATRTTKAAFTEVFSGPATRRFAERWDGAGLDPELVDREALRTEWLSPRPDVRSLVPIQAAWLASEQAEVRR